MPTLGEFHERVSEVINRADTFDSLIPNFVKLAARRIERRRNFQYMEKFDATKLDLAEDTRTYAISLLTSNQIKRINFWRIVNVTTGSDDVTFSYIEKVKAADALGRPKEKPSHFWLDAWDNFILLEIPDKAYLNTEMQWEEYTSWPATDMGQQPWLITNAEDLMIAQTMLLMAPRLRMDEKSVNLWAGLGKDALETLFTSEQETNIGAEVQQMSFG